MRTRVTGETDAPVGPATVVADEVRGRRRDITIEVQSGGYLGTKLKVDSPSASDARRVTEQMSAELHGRGFRARWKE